MNVYVIAAVGMERPSKIGFAVNVEKRLMQLQIGSPVKLYVYGQRWSCDPKAAEKEIHRQLKAKLLHGEWFDIEPQVAMSWVNDACKKLNRKNGHEIPALEARL